MITSNIPALPNDAEDFCFSAVISSTTDHILQKFIGGVSSRIVSEIIEYDKNPPAVTVNEYFYRMNNRRR